MLHNAPITLIKKREVAKNTIELTFQAPPEFSFRAGQYISLALPALSDRPIADKIHEFSVSSSPANLPEFSITFRTSQSIYKTALLSLPLGVSLLMNGPKGLLALPEKTDTPVIFVAGGIGVAPFFSMTQQATESGSTQRITLLYCNATEETTTYKEELSALAQKNPNFTLYLSLGNPRPNLFLPHITKTPNALWYIVGAPEMVMGVHKILKEFGILDTQIFIEEFSGYEST